MAFLFLSLVWPAWAEPVVEYYQEIAKTYSFPYQLEGLGPLMEPAGREHYRFLRDGRGQVLRVTHYNEKGEIADNSDGWADFHVFYDEKGNVRAGGYYTAAGKLKEKLKTPQKDLGISPMPPLKISPKSP